MASDYETRTECSDTCSNMVDADVPVDMDLEPETCERITDTVRDGGGTVVLTAEEVRRNPHVFSKDEAAEAEENEGHSLNIHVPECNFCGSDQ